jgi:hypothetical protein
MTIVLNGTSGITTPPVSVEGSTSGTITLAAPAVAGTNTQTLVAATGTLAPLIAGTAVASTSGTSIDFTGIPSWVRRITVMFNGVSTSGTNNWLLQLGAGSVTSTGYASQSAYAGATNQAGGVSSTAGFVVFSGNAANLMYGHVLFTLLGNNLWVGSHTLGLNVGGSIYNVAGGGVVTLSGTLDRVRITTAGGTDTFDAGSINILYE